MRQKRIFVRMKFYLNETDFIDTNEPLDIAIPLSATETNPRAWYVAPPSFEPVRTEHYTGAVIEGGAVNFRNIFFNPHGHGTHTECLGHITPEVVSVNRVLKTFWFRARLISLTPKEVSNGEETDRIITADQFPENLSQVEALIVRTLPNLKKKCTMDYSNTNPPYFDVECAQRMREAGIVHFLTDLPSVDRESDAGVLAFHHCFWGVPDTPDFERTITELIFVDDAIPDGDYVLNLQMASFENDAAPSRPVLYAIKK